MADKNIDILGSLKSCQIKPPENLFKKIWQALMQQDGSSLQDSSPVSVNSANPEINNNHEEYSLADREVFRSLQNYKIIPPAFSTLQLDGITAGKIAIPTVKKNGKVTGLKYFVRIAAAVLIIICGIWFANYKSHTKNNDESTAVITPQKSLSPINNTPIADTTAKAQTPRLVAGIYKLTHVSKSGEYLKKISSFRSVNTQSKLVDNDILLTLVSYKYGDYLPLLSEIRKDNTIKLDQFSYVTISEKMAAILKKMYATNHHNKPTRKAKRLKAKLEKWKKADEKHFDTNTNNNPLDIIDLSEFILK